MSSGSCSKVLAGPSGRGFLGLCRPRHVLALLFAKLGAVVHELLMQVVAHGLLYCSALRRPLAMRCGE